MASLMDYLPTGVVILDKENLCYINEKAWSILKCHSTDRVSKDISNVHCLGITDTK
jgi:hypothetical protein